MRGVSGGGHRSRRYSGMRVGGRGDGYRVSGVVADYRVRDAPNVVPALGLELNIDLVRE